MWLVNSGAVQNAVIFRLDTSTVSKWRGVWLLLLTRALVSGQAERWQLAAREHKQLPPDHETEMLARAEARPLEVLLLLAGVV